MKWPDGVDDRGALGHTRAMNVRLGLLLLLLSTACGAAQRAPDGTPRHDVVELDTIEIKTDRGSGKSLTYVKDHDAIVDQAMAEFHAEHWANAVRLYDILLKEFPNTPGSGAIAHNCGLALQNMGMHKEAVGRFAIARVQNTGTRHARDALFLQAESLELAGDVTGAATIYRDALDDPKTQEQIGGELGILDALEAAARMGLCWRAAGEIKQADDAFRRVERLYNDHRDVQVVGESEWVARSAYERGELYGELFASIRFKLPVDRMKRDLEDKANLFLKAENSYYHCVRLHHKQWSLAAGHNIGGLYTRLIDDIDNAEVPPEIGEQLADVYRDELWNHTEKLAKRATIIYRKNIELGKTLGASESDWVSKSEAGLSRMLETIDRNQARRARLLQAGAISAQPKKDEPPAPAP
jgi:tetratricopeptide (TPR) repeat protein